MLKFIRCICDRALYYLSVPKCLVCGEILDYSEPVICDNCRPDYREQKKRNCSRCAKILPECTCSNFFLESHYIKKLVKVYRYTPSNTELPGNILIYSLKHDNRRDTFNFLAEELAGAISSSFDFRNSRDNYIVTNVPRRPSAIRRDGYDHSAELAKRTAKILGLQYNQFLKSKAKRPQRETKGFERLKNASFQYKRNAKKSLKGKTVILIDDVVTTGSSMASCAALLRGMGTKTIVGATVSIAYKDSYKNPKPS